MQRITTIVDGVFLQYITFRHDYNNIELILPDIVHNIVTLHNDVVMDYWVKRHHTQTITEVSDGP